MELVNTTPYAVGCTVGTDRNGLDHLLAVAKGTYRLPSGEGVSRLHEQQRPLLVADEFTGAPGRSATREESDFALIKPRCDVLLSGSAYAPHAAPTTEVQVELMVGQLRKRFRVTGNRRWELGLLGGVAPGEPVPFTRMQFGYDTAFGGIDDLHPDARRHRSYPDNPVGIGYHRESDPERVTGTPMPNTEALDSPVRRPDGRYRPMALGPVGRGWPGRLEFAGTYDQAWQDDKFPFLADDFDDRYFQAAPPDQQTDYLRGGERVVLQNLTPDGYCAFLLPRMALRSVVFYLQSGDYRIARFVVDTLHLFPDDGLYTLTARASIPFADDPQRCAKVIFGRGSRAWVRALESGKTYVSWQRNSGGGSPASTTTGESG